MSWVVLAIGVYVLVVLAGFVGGDTGCLLWIAAFVLLIVGLLIIRNETRPGTVSVIHCIARRT